MAHERTPTPALSPPLAPSPGALPTAPAPAATPVAAAALIDRARVEHVAILAALSLGPGEAERFTAELAAIVAYVEELAALDTEGVPPTAHITYATLERGEGGKDSGSHFAPAAGSSQDSHLGHASHLRSDEVMPSLSREEALRQAPRQDHDGFAVPAFVGS